MIDSGTEDRRTFSILTILSLLIVIGSLAASLGGLLLVEPAEGTGNFTSLYGETVRLDGRGLYARDSVSCASQARGQDVVTLIVGIPLLAVGTWCGRSRNLRARMLQSGSLGYMLYTYASYAFLINYNDFFLLYVALFALSFQAFVLSFRSFGSDEVASALRPGFPRRYLGIYLLVMGSLLALMWLGRIIPSMNSTLPPAGLEHYTTLVIQVLDLAVVVPTAFITGILLLKRRQLGATLAAILFIKLLTMACALFAMMTMMFLSGVKLAVAEAIIFTVMLAFGIHAALVMFLSVPKTA